MSDNCYTEETPNPTWGTFCKRLSLSVPWIPVYKMGLSACALPHDDYLTFPELQNSQLTNHCPNVRHCERDLNYRPL